VETELVENEKAVVLVELCWDAYVDPALVNAVYVETL
jgi:hypothetical protein